MIFGSVELILFGEVVQVLWSMHQKPNGTNHLDSDANSTKNLQSTVSNNSQPWWGSSSSIGHQAISKGVFGGTAMTLSPPDPSNGDLGTQTSNSSSQAKQGRPDDGSHGLVSKGVLQSGNYFEASFQIFT